LFNDCSLTLDRTPHPEEAVEAGPLAHVQYQDQEEEEEEQEQKQEQRRLAEEGVLEAVLVLRPHRWALHSTAVATVGEQQY
jgi:hypothetical protein